MRQTCRKEYHMFLFFSPTSFLFFLSLFLSSCFSCPPTWIFKKTRRERGPTLPRCIFDLALNRKPSGPSKLPKQRATEPKARRPYGTMRRTMQSTVGDVCHKHEKMRDTENVCNNAALWPPTLNLKTDE